MAEVVRNVTHFASPHTHALIGEFKLKPHHAPRPTSEKSTSRDQDSFTDSSLIIQEQPLSERRPRKSVAFSGDNTIMDENGEISEAPPSGAEDKTTAEKHSSRMPSPNIETPTPKLKSRSRLTLENTAAPEDKTVDEMTDMFAGLNKKKKKSSKPKAEDAADGDAPAVSAGGDFDASALKKKKKKSSKPKTEGATDDFAEKLAKAGLEGPSGDQEGEQAAGSETQDQSGDMTTGTGIWSHDASTPISYDLLLKRFFQLVNEHNPDILSSGSKSYKIPPPQCLREGNKKTIFANIAEICKRMNRNDEHVTQFLFAELGTSGSVDGSKRLVIKGRFQQKQIENVLRRYIVEYVTCKTCRSPNTELSKGENRLYFVTCNSCGSRRSVTAIKSGFTAQVGKRKRLNG